MLDGMTGSEVGHEPRDEADDATMNARVRATFREAEGTHEITVVAPEGNKVLRSIRRVPCEDVGVCVCMVESEPKKGTPTNVNDVGESFVGISIQRWQPFEFVVIIGEGDVLTACSVRHT